MAKYQPGGPVFNSKQKAAMRQLHSTGSMMITDTEAITDEGGQQRIAWTDAGSLLLKDDAGTTGITLDADTNTIIAGRLTSTGLITGTAGITLTTGDVTVSTGDVTVSTGDVTVTAGNVDMVAGTLDVQNGATVTQGTGGIRTDAVSINFPTGKVTGDDEDLDFGTTQKHTVNNSTVAATDVVIINKISGDNDTIATVDNVAAGSFNVRLYHIAASGTDTTAFVYNFVVIKGSQS
jgi:hypothetical protein